MSWPLVLLGDVIASHRNGFAYGGDEPTGVVQLRMNNVSTDGSLDFAKVRRVPSETRGIKEMMAEEGDVLFNATNSPELVGKSAYISYLGFPLTYSNHFIRLRPESTYLDGRYLSRWLQFEWQRGAFSRMCKQWVNQATVGADRLLASQIPLPPLPEQRRIAAILEQADALRRLRRQSLSRVSDLGQAIFFEMFDDPIINSKGFPTKKLGFLGTLDRGKSQHRPRNDPALLGGPYPLIQTGDVAKSQDFIRSYTSTYSEMGLRQSKLWKRGTLCITIAADLFP